MIRVLIADDHAIVRRGLRQILSEERDLVVEAEAGSGDELLRALAQYSVDVVVLDLSMPGRNGLEVLADVRRERPKLPVLILSMHREDQLAVRALAAGAAGYVSKDSAPVELLQAIRKVVRGGRYVSETLAESLALQLQEAPPDVARLSDREFEVLRQLAAGRRVKEIAADLALSSKTVSTYRARILEKLELRTNADLTLFAAARGLVPGAEVR